MLRHLPLAPNSFLRDKRVLVIGGTGSLGRVLLRRLLAGEAGTPAKVVVFSRDEAKQYQLRLEFQNRSVATDEIIFENSTRVLQFRIGDIRDYAALCGALHDVDIVFNAAALKQVPSCEYCPYEAVMTNINGAQNIVRAIRDLRLKVGAVVGISTDKAVKPVNVMGMTKALQERILTSGGLHAPDTRFIVVRYGNVLASRGSVIPLFHHQIRSGGPVTITHPEMTRFLLSLNDAVSAIFSAVREGRSSEIYVPRIPSARMVDIAAALIEQRPIKTAIVGIRLGEKLHEILISEEESHRTFERGTFYVVGPTVPELKGPRPDGQLLEREYSSRDEVMTLDEVHSLLRRNSLTVSAVPDKERELVR
jgi:FlaA1/EpsC-like NDP-sugar epimerase